jgi:hypothetical protein
LLTGSLPAQGGDVERAEQAAAGLFDVQLAAGGRAGQADGCLQAVSLPASQPARPATALLTIRAR